MIEIPLSFKFSLRKARLRLNFSTGTVVAALSSLVILVLDTSSMRGLIRDLHNPGLGTVVIHYKI